MKRWLIFALLGPPIGTLVLGFVVGPLSLWMQGLPVGFDWGRVLVTLAALPLGSLFGLVPALLMALLDWFLQRRNVGYRPLWSGLAGQSVGLPFSDVLLFDPTRFDLFNQLLFGLIGTIPAAICSWLAGRHSGRAA